MYMYMYMYMYMNAQVSVKLVVPSIVQCFIFLFIIIMIIMYYQKNLSSWCSVCIAHLLRGLLLYSKCIYSVLCVYYTSTVQASGKRLPCLDVAHKQPITLNRHLILLWAFSPHELLCRPMQLPKLYGCL